VEEYVLDTPVLARDGRELGVKLLDASPTQTMRSTRWTLGARARGIGLSTLVVESLIRRIKGYRARGALTAGVPLRKGVSTFRALATEPALDKSLPWLDPTNDDDRMIATVVEVMRQHPRSTVMLVTQDINLQNKAELASVPYVEPPVAKAPERQADE
jgi:predicted ribonuclease YlaK